MTVQGIIISFYSSPLLLHFQSGPGSHLMMSYAFSWDSFGSIPLRCLLLFSCSLFLPRGFHCGSAGEEDEVVKETRQMGDCVSVRLARHHHSFHLLAEALPQQFGNGRGDTRQSAISVLKRNKFALSLLFLWAGGGGCGCCLSSNEARTTQQMRRDAKR